MRTAGGVIDLSVLTGSIPDKACERTPGDDSDENGRETPKVVTIQSKLFITKNKEMYFLADKISFRKIMSAPRY